MKLNDEQIESLYELLCEVIDDYDLFYTFLRKEKLFSSASGIMTNKAQCLVVLAKIKEYENEKNGLT